MICNLTNRLPAARHGVAECVPAECSGKGQVGAELTVGIVRRYSGTTSVEVRHRTAVVAVRSIARSPCCVDSQASAAMGTHAHSNMMLDRPRFVHSMFVCPRP